MSGGSGTRLWPVSRQRHPKQFAEIVGQHSLLVATLQMLQKYTEFSAPLVIANEDHKFFVLDALSQVGLSSSSILLEPCARNTAAAALAAALYEPQGDEQVLHLLLPSDHVIDDPDAFFIAIQKASSAAARGHITLFGIAPTYPETGYGYIQRGSPTSWPSLDRIERFKEKPDLEAAKTLVQEGALWNSGIFLYDPEALRSELTRLAPESVNLCQTALDNATLDLGCKTLERSVYENLPNISFDNLVMENTKLGVVVPCVMGWSDVGSWQTLWQLGEKNSSGNVVQGPITTLDVHHSYLRSNGPTLGVIGMDNVVVVATKDAVLVVPRERSQEVKNLVAQLEKSGQKSALEHPRVMRPWGHYEGVAEGQRFQVKHIVVKPGQALSLQMHYHRAEHWVVVAGTALVECEGKSQTVLENQSVFIPKGSKHRLSNQEDVELHLVEVQSGDYLGEDDIVRFSDNYGRV